jgi:hypothetical protein
VSEHLYRLTVDGDVNFDYYMRYAMSPDREMPHGTIVHRDTNGQAVG